MDKNQIYKLSKLLKKFYVEKNEVKEVENINILLNENKFDLKKFIENEQLYYIEIPEIETILNIIEIKEIKSIFKIVFKIVQYKEKLIYDFAGFILIKKEKDNSISIDLLKIVKEFKGKGIAKKLINEIKNNTENIHCYIDYGSKKFWKKMGFNCSGNEAEWKNNN